MAYADSIASNSNQYGEKSQLNDEIHVDEPEYKKTQNPMQVSHGIVISGEASESDDEVEPKPISGIPPSGSNFSLTESWCRQSTEESEQNDLTKSDDFLKYNTLLHKKLRERNQNLRKGLIDMACQPYQSASKEIHNISQQLIKSQILVQEVTSTLRRITNELFQLQDRVQSIKNGSFLPDIDISAIPPLDSP